MLSFEDDFKKKYDINERINQSTKLKIKFVDRIPVIIYKSKKSNNINEIDKNKFLIPKDFIVSQLHLIIRKRVKLDKDKAMFLLCNNCIINNSYTINILYEKYKDNDGFLYISYNTENAFG